MRDWWQKKKTNTRKYKKRNDHYSFLDILADILFWIPEILLLPFRLLFWIVRGFGRLFHDIFDIT
ncbi:MAG TPA: hypothetical protein VKZ77_13890 [Bacillaceae bacterium]|nr:hypothetical protein [Paenibacillus bovis]HLU23552.1 hypothetical protein [Bacillaceae bacterium]